MLAQLSRQGDFVTPESYVYVLSSEGDILASGGPLAIYIGQDIRPTLDGELKAALEEALSNPSADAPIAASISG